MALFHKEYKEYVICSTCKLTKFCREDGKKFICYACDHGNFPRFKHLWQSINSTFYPTTTPHRSMQQYPKQNMTRSSESSTSVKRNASESQNSINEINSFSTTRLNESFATSTNLKRGKQ